MLYKLIMLLINKKYIAISIFGCLILGIIIYKPIMSVFQHTETLIDAPDAIYMARDITTYTQQSDLIIIGKVTEVNDPYVIGDTVTLQQDAQIDVQEVLKGDPAIKSVKVEGLANQIEGGYWPEKLATLKGTYGLLVSGEKVLLFVGKETSGRYVVFAGPLGKYLIDDNNNVSSTTDFKMSLQDLKVKIQDALKTVAPKYTPPDISNEI